MNEISKINNSEVFSVTITPEELEPLIKSAAKSFMAKHEPTEKHAISSMDIITVLPPVVVQVVAVQHHVSIGVETGE